MKSPTMVWYQTYSRGPLNGVRRRKNVWIATDLYKPTMTQFIDIFVLNNHKRGA